MNVRSVYKSILTVILLFGITTNTFSQNINTEENFPDSQFRMVVEEFMGVDRGGAFTAAEASTKNGKLDCAMRGIYDLTGIKLFPALSGLECGQNQLSNLDVSNNTALEELSCSNNQLTNLDISNNTALTTLVCNANSFTSLDVSHNTALAKLACGGNQLASLDVSNNTALEELSCIFNQLTTLDVSYNTALEKLNCVFNQLTSLDISNNTALERLNCQSNELTSLDVSNNTVLTELWCDVNRLTSLDVSHNTVLTILRCSNNLLTSLDVSNNNKLTDLYCSANQLSSLDVSHNTGLAKLYCMENQLTSLDVSHNTALESINCRNNQLLNLDFSQNAEIVRIYCYENQLTSLDFSNNADLELLNCKDNQLTSLNVTYNTALEDLDCQNNQLTSLDVSNNTALTKLICCDNQLTSLSSFAANEGLGSGDIVSVTRNYIGCVDPDSAVRDIQILIKKMGDGFAYEPQKDCASMSPASTASTALIVNHTCTDLSTVSSTDINTARSQFRIWYGHTSHGSQILTGMETMNSSPYTFSWDGTGGSLSIQDEWNDLGYDGDLGWADRTREVLDAPGNDRNMIMWSWCGGVSDISYAGVNTYLSAMNQLEIDYPDVTFVYMTGHLDGTGSAGNLHFRNEQIRNYCRNNNKILFDFADIERYDPDGNDFLDLGAGYDGMTIPTIMAATGRMNGSRGILVKRLLV